MAHEQRRENGLADTGVRAGDEDRAQRSGRAVGESWTDGLVDWQGVADLQSDRRFDEFLITYRSWQIANSR
jgi:hypothetical protein